MLKVQCKEKTTTNTIPSVPRSSSCEYSMTHKLKEPNVMNISPPSSVNSVDTIKHIIKHLMKNKGRDEEPSEQEINQAMIEFQEANKVPLRRL